MKLSILIVNWNTKKLVANCINSIYRFAPGFDYEIIVVDNASRDGSLEALRGNFSTNPEVKIIGSTENLGFAKGNNLAYERSSGEYVLLLNPDTQVRAGSLEKLVGYLDAHPEAGVAGGQIINPDGLKLTIEGNVVIEKNARIIQSTVRGPAIIGENTVVKNSYVGPYTSIYHDTLLENCEIEHSIVLENSVIRGIKRIEGSLIGQNAVVTQSPAKPSAYRIMIGDSSRVEIP